MKECSICLNFYDYSYHKPVTLLNCTHVLCKTCASKMKTCPFCKNEIISTKTCFLMLEFMDSEIVDKEANKKAQTTSNDACSLNHKNILLNDEQLVAKHFLLENIEKSQQVDDDLDNIFDAKHVCDLTSELNISKAIFDRSFGLMGKAGSGKTFLIANLSFELIGSEKKIILISPTHTAATVLSENLESLSLNLERDLNFKYKFFVKTLASFLRRREYDGQNLNLLSENEYAKTVQLYGESPISAYDVIIFDESSMISINDLIDLENRIKTDFKKKFSKKIPCLIFCGDFRQLGPIQESAQKNPLASLGYVSYHVLCNKNKTVQLVNNMRSDKKDLNLLFSTIGDEIEKYVYSRHKCPPIEMVPFKDQNLSLDKYYMLVNEFSKDSQSIKVMNKTDGIEMYANMLKNNQKSNESFWVHYNNDFHQNTIDLVSAIRYKYFQKILKTIDLNYVKKDYLRNLFAAGDYLKYTSNIRYQTCYKFELKLSQLEISNSLFKKYYQGEDISEMQDLIPGSKVKLIDIFERKYKIEKIFSKFDLKNITLFNTQKLASVNFYVCMTRNANKPSFLISLPNIEINNGYYNKQKKTQENISVRLDNELILKIDSIPYSSFLKKNLKDSLNSLDIKNVFSFSYVGSSHTVQGDSIDTIFIGEENILRDNCLNLTAFSSMYTTMTRAKKSVVIVRT